MQSKYFTTEWQLRMLSRTSSWFLDTHVLNLPHQRQHSAYNLFVILCQDPSTHVVIPCFFGIFINSNSAFNYEVYARLLRVLLLKSPNLIDPAFLVVDYDDELRRAVAEIFPRAVVASSFVHRTNYLWKLCKNLSCSLRGVKALDVTYFVSYFLVISMLPPQLFAKNWQALLEKLDPEGFKEVVRRIEEDFVSPTGKYHTELSIEPFLQEKSFEVASSAIEAYRYRMFHMIKHFNVASPETLAEKILINEEKIFAGKVAEISQGLATSTDLPDMLFLERRLGSLQISTTMSDINSWKMQLDPQTLAELLVRNSELRQMGGGY